MYIRHDRARSENRKKNDERICFKKNFGVVVEPIDNWKFIGTCRKFVSHLIRWQYAVLFTEIGTVPSHCLCEAAWEVDYVLFVLVWHYAISFISFLSFLPTSVCLELLPWLPSLWTLQKPALPHTCATCRPESTGARQPINGLKNSEIAWYVAIIRKMLNIGH